MKTNTARNVLLILLGFLALGAIIGGGTLTISPTGKLLRMPLYLLEKSPFNNYLIPGIILFSVFGLAPLLLIFALIKNPIGKFAETFNFFKDMHWSWTYSIYVAFALIIWLQIEMMFLQTVYWIHTFYMIYAIVLIFVALLPQIRNIYKKTNTNSKK
jgi:hypothetical protein